MQFLTELVKSMGKVVDIFSNFIGFSPVYLLPVFVFVHLTVKLFDVKNKFENIDEFIIGILCIAYGIGVSYFISYDNLKELFENGLFLGSVAALTYQIAKSLAKGAKKVVEKKWKEKTGAEIDI